MTLGMDSVPLGQSLMTLVMDNVPLEQSHYDTCYEQSATGTGSL
jgi:hypothetical protein